MNISQYFIVSCNQCNYKTVSKVKLENHMKVKHQQKTQICKFYLEGRCTRQGCTYKHEKQETSIHKSDKKRCNRGPTCYHKSQNKCHFYHPENEVQEVQQINCNQNGNWGSHDIRTQTLWCKYQEACNNNSCPFKHFPNNLLKQTQKRGPMFI